MAQLLRATTGPHPVLVAFQLSTGYRQDSCGSLHPILHDKSRDRQPRASEIATDDNDRLEVDGKRRGVEIKRKNGNGSGKS